MRLIHTETEEELYDVIHSKFKKGDTIQVQTIMSRKDRHAGKYLGVKYVEEQDEYRLYLQVSETKGAFVCLDEIMFVVNGTQKISIDNVDTVNISIIVINVINALIGLVLAGGTLFVISVLLKVLGVM